MSNLILPRRQIWTGQPQGLPRSDPDNPFGARCDFAWTPLFDKSGNAKLVSPVGIATDFISRVSVGFSPAVVNRPFAVVLVMAFPTANINSGYGVYVGAGNGFRLNVYTSGGGIYAGWTANGIANGAFAARDSSGTFDMRPVVLVSEWTSTGQTSYWRRLGDVGITSWSDAFGYNPPSDTRVYLGQSGVGACKMYGAFILKGNVGADGAKRLLDNPWQIFAPRTTYLFSVTALANIISLGLVSAQFSAQAYQASADRALGAGSVGAGAYAVASAGVLSTAVGTVPVTSQAAFVSAVQSLQSTSVSLNSPDLDYILGALDNAVSLGLASISSTARAITYSTPGGTVHVVPYEFLGDYDIVHFSGSIAVDRAGALIIVLR